VIFNEAKMTYKNLVEKLKLLLDLFYLRYKHDVSFQSVRDDDNDQSVTVDQSVRERENSDSKNSKNSGQEQNLIETVSSADSLTEVQSVRRNLISSPADSSQSVKVDQAASHAAENTLVVSANQNDNDEELSVLMSDSKSNEMINHQSDDQTQSKKMINQQEADNRLISEENNSLILNYSRSKIRHNYKQLHHKSFVKAAKSIESTADHDLITFKTFEQIINDSQAKE
jgi:acetyl/propionyl-CoA carboxylase alpha subunit